MKKAVIIAGLAAALLCEGATASTNYQLFNVRFGITMAATSIGYPIIISTNTPDYTYSTAGIKVNSPEFILGLPGVDCQPSPNGYCLFRVSDTSPAHILIIPTPALNLANPIVTINLNLCLNGTGNTFSCENHIVTNAPQF